MQNLFCPSLAPEGLSKAEELKPEAAAKPPASSIHPPAGERQPLCKVVFNPILHSVVPFPTGEACSCKDAAFFTAAYGEWGSAIELHLKHMPIHEAALITQP